MGDWSDRNSCPSSPVQTDQLHFYAFCPVSETSYLLLSPLPPLPSYTLIFCAVAVGPTSSCGVWSESFATILPLSPWSGWELWIDMWPNYGFSWKHEKSVMLKLWGNFGFLSSRDMCGWFWPCLYSSASLHGQHCVCFSTCSLVTMCP